MKVAPLPKWPAAVGLVTGSILLTRSAQTTFAADKPVHAAIATLATCGIVVVALSRVLSREIYGGGGKAGGYEAVPLRDVRHSEDGEGEDEEREPYQNPPPPVSLRRLRTCFVVLVLALCLRAEILHRVLKNVQCSTHSWTPLLPLAFALEEWWRYRRGRGGDSSVDMDDEEASAYEALATFVGQMPLSRVISVAFVVLGGMLAMAATATPRSTFICAATLPYRLQVPHLQLLGTCLDVVIVWSIAQLVTLNPSSRSLAGRAAAVGYAFLTSAFAFLSIGIVYYLAEEADRTWIRQISPRFVWSLLRLDMYIVITLLCALALILHVGVLTTSLLATFSSIMTISTVFAWNNAHPFPPTYLGFGLFAVSLTMLGLVVYFSLDLPSKHNPPLFSNGVTVWVHLILLTIFLVWTSLFFSTSTSVTFHPIDMLMYQAQAHHEVFLAQASASENLTQAVEVYQARHLQHPPPGFDRWYEFATARSSVIIDDFDSIHNDLLPFYALPPSVIRERTWELISNPWNDVAGINIRNGQVSVYDNGIPGTHAWMLDGLIEMIGKFVEHLPDMDLAFNLNDECRVAAPYELIQDLKQTASSQVSYFDKTKPRQTNFSPNRAAGWKPLPAEPNRETPLQEHSWQKIFESHGTIGCPPSSPARTLRTWDTSTLCTTCMSPHSLGLFLSDWQLAADVCHQPDLADLHGIYLSPAAFKATHELYPFFSQSKVSGFNDILYPSSWNYLEKAVYAPSDEHPDKPWAEKEDILFWRGATSEGVSQGWSQWKGMVRQRFVNLLSSSSTAKSIDLQSVGPIILPNTTDFNGNPIHNKFVYTSHSSLTSKTDVHVVDNIVRCFGPDCSDQAKALAPLVPGIDFQHHWSYKYLLDLDGAAFSGRFLPFLRSKSLPMKAGIFREWWDSRVEAWAHFVPLDVRGVGVKATLEFFANQGEDGARKGEKIANQGREWAEKVLRKEDMEVYMFRLLLEWGRVVDDGRDDVGFGG